MRVAASGRSAFVIRAQGESATIEVNQPSDCLALQKEHIACTEVDVIYVWFGYKFTSTVNGPAHHESSEEWHKALHHLLNTYKPGYCYIHTLGTETGLGKKVRMEVDTQRCYRGFWNSEKNLLTLKR